MKLRLFSFFIVLTLSFGAFSFYQYRTESNVELDAARAASDAQFLQSELGATRYQVFGDPTNPTVILVHSFNGFIESWQPNIQPLVDAGYQVVAYDLFGRGLSARPWVDYDLALFRHQLDQVIKQSGAKQVHLVGSSFGCVIASDYALQYPDRVRSLNLIGPAGWPAADGPNALLNVPVLAELIFHYFGKQLIQPTVDDYLIDRKRYSNVLAQWDHFASYPGFTRASLSILRHTPLADFNSGWKQLGKLDKPVQFVWGKQDVSFPFSHTAKIPTLIPQASIVGIDGAAHWVNVEKAAEVNHSVISFINQAAAQ